MERRKALAFAAAVTGSLGSATVAVAAIGGASVLGFGGGHHAQLSSLASSRSGAAGEAAVVTRTKDVYDRVTVAGGVDAPLRSAGLVSVTTPAPTIPAPATDATVTIPGSDPVTHHRRVPAQVVPRSTPHTPPATPHPTTTTTTPPQQLIETPTTTTTTIATTTTTTVPPVTTTTRPPGVPKDWPPGKPIPPMPPNCHQPQLEDNGVWNCDV
jgi:hypothetical protein